ncbi:autophagy-related protein 13 isoform X3 [Aplysia californica]|uniref:Autophagy-related protein 13 isoform X3 n=1 Tax=Aplysia californica TaxID=6500 RepID=A0ABM0JDZ5_APLCA|nr:autophagy-related protein 13 isoform X3 [Aplysia californica]
MATSDGSVSSLESSQVKETNIDVERLYRTFTYKCLQVIVQSRIEKKENARDKVQYENYFSLTLPDDPKLEEQIKKALDGARPFPVKDQSVCVEIPLVTSDGDHMFLETWDLTFNLSSLDIAVNKPQHIYTKMGITLKSLVCATRATPAYRLAKNQGEKGGGYKLNYRIYLGKPQTHNLGEGFKTYRAGAVPSAHGLLAINVAFRTRLLISPEMSSSQTATIEMRDNHFDQESPVKNAVLTPSKPQPCSPPQRSPETRSESPYCFAVSPTSAEQDEEYLRARLSSETDRWAQSGVFNMEELPEPVIGAFSNRHLGSRHQVQPSELYEGLMKRSLMMQQAQQMAAAARHKDADGESDVDGHREDRKVPECKAEEEKENIPSQEMRSVRSKENVTMEDDFIMKPPFAADDDPSDVKGFLGLIFRAPSLFEAQECKVTVDDYLSDVGELVMKSEEDMPVLDEFCQSVINLNSSEEDELAENSVFS